MKTAQILISIVSYFLFIVSGTAQNTNNDIEVQISNIESAEGTILIGLYNNENNFYKQPFRSAAIKAQKGSIKTTFEDIPSGEYAISLYHDENDNKKLDTNFFKIPKESYGTSNNAKGSFGPPTWEDAKFSVSENTVIQSIKL